MCCGLGRGKKQKPHCWCNLNCRKQNNDQKSDLGLRHFAVSPLRRCSVYSHLSFSLRTVYLSGGGSVSVVNRRRGTGNLLSNVAKTMETAVDLRRTRMKMGAISATDTWVFTRTTNQTGDAPGEAVCREGRLPEEWCARVCVGGKTLHTIQRSADAGAIFCTDSNISSSDTKRLNKLMKKAPPIRPHHTPTLSHGISGLVAQAPESAPTCTSDQKRALESGC